MEEYKGILYKYMDFTKFIALLESKALFFSRADQFQEYFKEGNLGNADILQLKYTSQQPLNIHFLRKNHLITCWNVSASESYTMWKAYGQDKHSVAIRTNVPDVFDSLKFGEEYFRKTEEFSKRTILANSIYGDTVTYYNPLTDSVPNGFAYEWRRFFYKPEAFKSEEEYRLLICGQRVYDMVKTHPDSGAFISKDGFVNVGEKVEIDITKLIKGVYVSPEAEGWFFELVCSIASRYGIDPSLVRKSLLV